MWANLVSIPCTTNNTDRHNMVGGNSTKLHVLLCSQVRPFYFQSYYFALHSVTDVNP